MKAMVRSLIITTILLAGIGVQGVLASVVPPLDAQIALHTKGLKTGVSAEVVLSVQVQKTADNRAASIRLTLTADGAVSILGTNEWVIHNFVLDELQQVPANFILNHPGNGRLRLQVETFDVDGNKLWGRADDMFFLVTRDEVLTGKSSGFKLRRLKLESDLANGLLNEAEFKDEVRKLMGGQELRFEKEMRGKPAGEVSVDPQIQAVVNTATISGKARYTHRTGRNAGADVFAADADARAIPDAVLWFYDLNGSTWTRLTTTPVEVRTNASGEYSATVPGKRGDGTAINLKVIVYADSAAAVIQTVGDGENHGKWSTAKVIDAAAITIDFLVKSDTPTVLGAFALHEGMLTSFNFVKSNNTSTGVGAAPAKIIVEFPGTRANGSFFSKNGVDHLNIGRNHAYDWDVYTHEYGHYIQKLNGTSQSPGGRHIHTNLTGFVQPPGSGNKTLTKDQALKLAWGEGWPTFFGTNLQITSGAGKFGIHTVADTVYSDTANNFSYGLEGNHSHWTGKGEDNEISVQRILWDFADSLQDGHDTMTFGNEAMWKNLHSDPKPVTLDQFRAKFDTLRPSSRYAGSGLTQEQYRVVYGRTYFDHNVGPEPTSPVDGFRANSPPTFKWKTKGAGAAPSYHFKKFKVKFWDKDFKNVVFTSPEIPTSEGTLAANGLTATWTPKAADWNTIAAADKILHWAVAGSHDLLDKATGPYLGLDRTIGGPDIIFVIDDTGSMGNEISGVRAGLTIFVDTLRALSLVYKPLIEVITFKDGVSHRVASQNLDDIQAAVNALSAGGGGDCEEASAEALQAAMTNLVKGGVIFFATDASPHKGYNLDGLKLQVAAKGIILNQLVSGDCDPEGGVPRVFSRLTGTGSMPLPSTLPVLPVDSRNPGYKPGPWDDQPAEWWYDVVCPDCTPGPGTGPVYTPNVLKEVGDYSLPTPSSVASFSDLATASPKGHFIYMPGVKSGDSEPFINAVANTALAAVVPTVIMVQAIEGYQGARMDIKVLGGSTNFAVNSTLSFSGAGITVNSVNPVSSTTLAANISIGAGAAIGLRDVTVATPLGGGKTESAGGKGQFRVIAATTDAKLVSISPSTIERAKSKFLSFSGINTNFASGVTTVSVTGTGVTVNSVTVNSPTKLNVKVTVAADAALGFHDVRIETGAEIIRLENVLTVVATIGLPPGLPTITSVTPSELPRGSSNLLLTVQGSDTNFVNGETTTSISGSGVTVQSTNVTGATTANVRVNVAAGAALGVRDIVLTTGGESAALVSALTVVVSGTTPPPTTGIPCDAAFVTLVDQGSALKVSPNGTDDTDNIQCALDVAIDRDVHTVKLPAGTFHISSLVAVNFNGNFQGNTLATTIVEVLDGSVDCAAMETAGLTPSIIKFTGGEPRVRFMTIRANQPCMAATRISHMLHFTGRPAIDDSCGNDVVFGTVDRVKLDGTSRLDGPVVAVSAEAEGNDLGGCNDSLLGTFKVNRSEIINTEIGVITTMKSGAQVDINFNTFMSNLIAVFLVNTNQNTTITSNTFTGDDAPDDAYFGVVVLTGSADAPAATRAVIHNNDFMVESTHGVFSVAITTQQPGRIANISSAVTRNRFDLNGAATIGLFSLDTSNTNVSANRFDGSGDSAIWIDGDTPVSGITISSNSGFGGFLSSSGFDIVLRANTSKCYVGPGQGATVFNAGVNNTILSIDEPSPEAGQNQLEYSKFSSKEIGAKYSRQLQDLTGRMHLHY